MRKSITLVFILLVFIGFSLFGEEGKWQDITQFKRFNAKVLKSGSVTFNKEFEYHPGGWWTEVRGKESKKVNEKYVLENTIKTFNINIPQTGRLFIFFDSFVKNLRFDCRIFVYVKDQKTKKLKDITNISFRYLVFTSQYADGKLRYRNPVQVGWLKKLSKIKFDDGLFLVERDNWQAQLFYPQTIMIKIVAPNYAGSHYWKGKAEYKIIFIPEEIDKIIENINKKIESIKKDIEFSQQRINYSRALLKVLIEGKRRAMESAITQFSGWEAIIEDLKLQKDLNNAGSSPEIILQILNPLKKVNDIEKRIRLEKEAQEREVNYIRELNVKLAKVSDRLKAAKQSKIEAIKNSI